MSSQEARRSISINSGDVARRFSNFIWRRSNHLVGGAAMSVATSAAP